MKTKILLLTLFITVSANAQFFLRLHDTITTNISFVVDPAASKKESGLNIGAEINYTEKAIYIHTGIQSFTVLEGGYYDWTTSGGIAFKIKGSKLFKLYTGPRLGFILREKYPYPTWGVEAGMDITVLKIIVIGLRSTYDDRQDFKYYGAPNEWRLSGFVKLGIKIR